MENYEDKYKKALEKAKENYHGGCLAPALLEYIFPELAESEDERIRKSLIAMLKNDEKCYLKEIAWFEKQGEKDKTNAVSNSQSEDEKIREEIIEHLRLEIEPEVTLSEEEGNKWIAWLETHKYTEKDLDEAYKCADEVQYTSGYNDAKEEFEKQCEQNHNILWHDVNKRPEENRELLCEWKGEDGTWYDIAFYHAYDKTFWSDSGQIENVVRWIYIDEIVEGEPQDKGEISDGYHTFNELYRYRMLYNAAFFNLLPKEWVHKSKKHNDGEECFGGGWFIVMANLPTGQISNHYELKDWDLFQIPEKETADKWDGHTPQEAANRLYKYLLESKTNAVPNSQSEDNEIRKEIISFLKWFDANKNKDKWIAWLEKQEFFTEKDIDNAYLNGICAAKHELEKQSAQKLDWSQNDEDMVNDALNFAHEYGRHGLWCWLKSLKQRIGVQDEQKSEGC